MSWELITDQRRFNELLTTWASAEVLALDTEFIRVNTFNPQTALIQLNINQSIYLIDPIALDTKAMGTVFANQNSLKILHACSEDIEVFYHQYPQHKISHIFDTQVGLAFLGYGLQVGYQKALKECLNIEISKAETRSDWLARPLSPEQLQYAASDVEHLPKLYQFVVERLAARNLLSYCQQDCQQMLVEASESPVLKSIYQQFSNAWQFNRRQLSLLQMLAIWREGSARIHNIPRTFVLKNHTLLAIVQEAPQTLARLARIQDLHPRTYQKHGAMILEIVKQANDKTDAQCPPLLPLPLPKQAKGLFDQLRQTTEQVAHAHQIPADVLLRKRWLDSLVLGYIDDGEALVLPSALTGWRYEILTQPLLQILASQQSQLLKWRDYRHRRTMTV
ncbi:ribonuclease D [Agitococcus lubricus]|uniref:Ribonuclease D n=1 Tax=Agitococcus lubricus TaxID=1077255 RepID=A0A2T5IX74_9GAMM|nr:ribonuclease D [Agitococcus lubricus]PTQ88450.1 ribonuclease D [Agitococcus lubricus]